MVIPNKYEIGGKGDIELAKLIKARPYEEVLAHVGKDWGRNSDVYNFLLEIFVADKFDYKAFLQVLQNYDIYDEYAHLFNLNESIKSSEANNLKKAIQTLIDNKRNVAFITQPTNDIANLIGYYGLKSLKVPGNNYDAWIIYREGSEAQAKELLGLANKYGGYLSVKASDEDTIRIGQLLGYDESDINDYINRTGDHINRPDPKKIA